MMPIFTSSVFQPQTIAPTAPANPLDPVTADGTAVQAIGDAPPPASVSVELSPVAQFINAVSQSRQQLALLPDAAGAGQQNTLLGAVQNVVDAFNLLPTADYGQTLLEPINLQSQLVQSLTTTTGNASAPTTSEALAQIGISLRSPQLSNLGSSLALDNNVLASAFSGNSQTTTNTLQQTLDSFSQIAMQFAEQLSAAASSALPALTNTPPVPLTPADVIVNERLNLDRAELSTLPPPVAQQSAVNGPANQTAEQTATQAAAPSAQAPNNGAQVSPTANSAAAVPANVQTSPQIEQATAAAQAATQQSAAGLNTVLTAGAAAAAQATAAQSAAAAAAQAASSASTTQNTSANVAAAAAALEQAQAAQRAIDFLIQQHDAALAAAAQVGSTQQTAATNATQTTAANLAAAIAAVDAAAQEARAAEDAATQAAQAQALLAPAPAGSPANTPAPAAQPAVSAAAASETQSPAAVLQQQLALQLDPLRANPALAGAIAAYNLAGGRVATAPVPSAAPQRVSPVNASARAGTISTGTGGGV